MAVKEKRRLKTTSTRRKKQQVKDRQFDDRDWAGLADYLLELVIERLPIVDCLSFSSVCMGWESVATKLFERSSRGIPLLVKPGQNENITRTCLNVLHKNKNTSLDIPMSEYIGSYIWGSYRDWLILVRPFNHYNVHITLLNPFSGEKVVLPKTPDEYHMVVLSSGFGRVSMEPMGYSSTWTHGLFVYLDAMSIMLMTGVLLACTRKILFGLAPFGNLVKTGQASGSPHLFGGARGS